MSQVWIACSDLMPPTGTDVWISVLEDEDGPAEVAVAKLNMEDDPPFFPGFENSESIYDLKCVSHWMPLVKPVAPTE